jgi:murein DD-endopeptidase MepM/ murein hydrolase activator NlpD
MQPHSLRVGVGDQVKRGQEIGLLGDTGNTDAPHLHLHVIDGPGALSSNGLPFVIDSFGSEGTVTSSEQALTDGKPVVIGPALAGTHRNQMPLDDMVISFPASSGNDQ